MTTPSEEQAYIQKGIDELAKLVVRDPVAMIAFALLVMARDKR